MKNYAKILGLLVTAASLASTTAGCIPLTGGRSSASETKVSEELTTRDTTAAAAETVTANIPEPVSSLSDTLPTPEELFTTKDISPPLVENDAEINLMGSKAEVEGTGVTIEGSTVTITSEGIYSISGELTNGQIIIDAPEASVHLKLNNVNITSGTSAPLLINDAKKTYITLGYNSVNSLTDGRSDTIPEAEDVPDAALFSRDSLTINGGGTLNISGNYCGIRSKDDIVITGGALNITAGSDGIKAKDYVAVADGKLNITAGGDGIKASGKDENALGFVYTEGGSFDISSMGDGIQAEGIFSAKGGDFRITTAGGNDLSGGYKNTDKDMSPDDIGSSQTGLPEVFGGEAPNSKKGIKAGTELNISGGTFSINSADDALHSNGSAFISGEAAVTLSAEDDGIHADNSISVSGGTLRIFNAREGFESAVMDISGGDVRIFAEDDGINAGDGTPSSHKEDPVEGVSVVISGGTLYANAIGGDGLDSNGDLTILGGDITVNGPEHGMNSALDCNGVFIVSGGTLIAAGYHDMADYPSQSSTQCSVSIGFDTIFEAGTPFVLEDESGKELLRYAPVHSYDHLVISTPLLEKGKTYTAYAGDGGEGGSFTFTVSEMTTRQGLQTYMEQFRDN